MLVNTASSFVKSFGLTQFTLIVIPKVFIEHQNLMLKIADLTVESDMITYITKTIGVHKQAFTLWTKV